MLVILRLALDADTATRPRPPSRAQEKLKAGQSLIQLLSAAQHGHCCTLENVAPPRVTTPTSSAASETVACFCTEATVRLSHVSSQYLTLVGPWRGVRPKEGATTPWFLSNKWQVCLALPQHVGTWSSRPQPPVCRSSLSVPMQNWLLDQLGPRERHKPPFQSADAVTHAHACTLCHKVRANCAHFPCREMHISVFTRVANCVSCTDVEPRDGTLSSCEEVLSHTVAT